ncbi:MAG: leucine-rich repeat protein, partial [Candidatus Methanomethylophilaceae archaeon]|nr:leucine-rich repeat protein [Candidatus Methanomethylophilaceae archaeon]
METGNPTILRNRRSNSAEGIKKDDGFGRRLILVLLLIASVVCVSFLILNPATPSVPSVQEQDPQTVLLEEIANNEGMFDEQSIVLYNISPAIADEFAEKVNGSLRMSFDRKFATITLPSSVSIKDVASDSEFSDYFSSISLDYHVSASEIESDLRLPMSPSVSASDPFYGSQSYLDYLNLKDTWNHTKGAGITVAVIDTGIDTDHPEFIGRISEYSYNASLDKVVKDYDDWSLIEDEQGHGTAVSGVIAAAWNDIGVAGISPDVELLVIKAECYDNGSFVRTSDLVFGLYYAIERDVDVVNMSFGGAADDNPYAAATKLAVDSDIICVAAAGNESTSDLTYPAADPNVIGVGALSASDWGLAEYSNYGENSDIVAPGTTFTTEMGGGYDIANGTSLASPVVTAVLALYLSQNPYQEFSDVMEILYASCYDLGSPGDDWYFGFGALDAYALLFEERGIVTFDMLTDEIDDIEKIFIRGHALQDIPEPERLYSVFDGWYYDINCTEEYNWYLDVFTSDLTLYASWVNEDDTVPYTYVELGDGTIEILSYTGHRKYLTIPDIIDGKEVSSISDSAFKNETNVRSINLPERLKTIKVSAFEGCTSLVSINIPNTVESIGEAAFKNCQRLEGVELTSESSLNVIGMFAFQNCSSLSRFDIPEKVMSLEGSVFYGCTRMSSFILDSDNRNFTVKDGVLFNKVATKIIAYPAGKGTSYNIPGIVCDIGDYSFGYSKLRFIDLKSISYVGECAFAYSKLESLIIGDGVTACGKGAFSNCFDLSSVEIGNGLRDISEELFSGTFSLKSIIIPPQVISISAAAFSNSGLTSITFDEYSSLVSIGFASFVDSSLISISIPDSLLLIGDYAFSGTLSLNSIVFSDDSNLQKIGLKAFENTPSLESVELPSNLWMIGEYAFLDSGLKGSISIPASVAEIGGGAFASCVGITSFSVEDDNKSYVAKDGVLYSASGDVLVEYPAGRVGSTYSVLDSVETIYHSAFYGSINLDSIVLPESLIDIQQHSFYLVSNLLSISIPANVISIGMYAFAMDWSLSIIEFTGESKITRFGLGTFSYSGIVSLIIPASVTSIAQGAFTSCSQLHNIIFAENSCLEYVSAYMFDGCDNLTNVTFQNGSKLTSIQAHGFHNASALMSINFGDAKLLNVGNYSFMSCESLLSITLPDTLEEIGRFAFYGCSSLSEVKIPSNVKFIGRVAFDTGSGIRIYFDSDVPPTHLQEGWDDGVRGYHFGIKDILECEDWTYAILESGNVSIIEYRGDEKQLDLSSFVFGDVVTIGNGAFKRSPITSIVLPNTLTTIQAEAFEDSMLESITIPLGVKFIGREAFQNSALNSISFEGSSSVQVIEKYAFAYLDYLNSFDLPSSVDTLGVGVFQQSNIKSFAFESGSSLTEIPEMAFYGTSIESIILPDSVSHIGHSAFRDITSLRFIDLGDSERLTIESNVFYHCGLTSLFIGKNVDYIGEYAFVGLNSLQHFTVDSENPKYKSVDGILFTKDGKKLISCPSGKLGSYVIPVNVETIGFGAFEDTTLSSIDFAPGINITSIGYRAFFNADNLETIFIPSSVVSIDYYAFAYCDNLVEVLFGEDSLLTGVYEGVFYGCSSLSSIVLPESVREISDFAFYGCSSLISIPVSDDSEILEFGSYSFAHSGLVELNVPSNVVCIGDYAFRATDITEATIDVESIIDLRLGFGIFADNTSIETLTIPFLGAFFDEGGAWLGYTFGASMYSYNGDYVPSSLKYLHIIGDITYLYDGAFYNCSNLEEIVFPDTLVSMSNCDVFFSCSAKSNLVWDLNYYEGYLDEVHCSLDPLYGLIMPNEADQYNIAGDILNFRISSKNLTEIYFGDSCPDLTGMVISAPNLNKIYISENNRSISESSGIIYNYEKTEAVIVLTLSKKVMIPGTLRIVPERFINQNVGVVDLVIEEG